MGKGIIGWWKALGDQWLEDLVVVWTGMGVVLVLIVYILRRWWVKIRDDMQIWVKSYFVNSPRVYRAGLEHMRSSTFWWSTPTGVPDDGIRLENSGIDWILREEGWFWFSLLKKVLWILMFYLSIADKQSCQFGMESRTIKSRNQERARPATWDRWLRSIICFKAIHHNH